MRTEFKDLLRTSGCAVEETLSRFMDNEDIYERFLYKFLDDPNYDKFEEFYEQGNTEEAFRCAHTLKGVTANLGLTPICNVLVELVEKLRKNEMDEDSNRYNELFQKEFARIMGIIREESKR